MAGARTAGMLCTALGALLLAAPAARAAPIECDTAALVDAIDDANADPDATPIELAPGCTYTLPEAENADGAARKNAVAFTGRIGGAPLRPGAHRRVVSAVDAAGNRSAAAGRAGFTIVRRR